MLTLPFENWFKVMESRRSRRTFISKPIEDEVIKSLNDVIKQLNKLHKDVSLKLIEYSPEEILNGIVGPYGKITGAPAYIAVVVQNFEPFLIERGGYIGQAMALEATVQGLATCWVGGLFNEVVITKQVRLQEDEKVISVLPIGYARKNYSLTEKMMSQVGDYHKRKTIEELVEGLPEKRWPTWIKTTLHAARFAPSAYNRQPVRFFIGEDHSITVMLVNPKEETNVPKEIDRGIAMLHIDLALKHHNIDGEWHYCENKSEVIFKEEP